MNTFIQYNVIALLFFASAAMVLCASVYVSILMNDASDMPAYNTEQRSRNRHGHPYRRAI